MNELDYEIDILFNGVKATLNREQWNDYINLIQDGDRIEIINVRY